MCVCYIFESHATIGHIQKHTYMYIYIYIYIHVYICVLHLYSSHASIAHIQPIADRVTQNLEIIPNNMTTYENSANEIYG